MDAREAAEHLACLWKQDMDGQEPDLSPSVRLRMVELDPATLSILIMLASKLIPFFFAQCGYDANAMQRAAKRGLSRPQKREVARALREEMGGWIPWAMNGGPWLTASAIKVVAMEQSLPMLKVLQGV